MRKDVESGTYRRLQAWDRLPAPSPGGQPMTISDKAKKALELADALAAAARRLREQNEVLRKAGKAPKKS